MVQFHLPFQVPMRTWKEVPRPRHWRGLSRVGDLVQLEPNLERTAGKQDLEFWRRTPCLCLGSVSWPPKGGAGFKFLKVNQIGFVNFQPPNEYNLVTNWSGSPVEFYANVSYNCASSDLHFEADFDQLSWDGAVCLSNGSWQLLDNWPSCLKSKSFLLTLRGNEPYIVKTTEEKNDVSLPYFKEFGGKSVSFKSSQLCS